MIQCPRPPRDESQNVSAPSPSPSPFLLSARLAQHDLAPALGGIAVNWISYYQVGDDQNGFDSDFVPVSLPVAAFVLSHSCQCSPVAN
eukprot:COSAG02_NODE_327_length_24561_cov_92.867754_12_plen_88_part_00